MFVLKDEGANINRVSMRKESKMPKLKIGVRVRLLPGNDLRQKFLNAKKYGFEAIEFRGANIREMQKEISQLSLETGIKVSAISIAGYKGNLLSKEREERERAIQDIEDLLKITADLRAVGQIIVPIFGPSQLPDMSPWLKAEEAEKKLLIGILKHLVKVAEKVNSFCLLEPVNRYETHLINRLDQALEICRKVGSSRVGIVADYFHMNIEERNIGESIKKASSFLKHIHLSDSNRLLPGWGHINFKEEFKTLKDIGYRGYMVLESYPYEVPGDPEQELPKCVEYLRSCWDSVS